MALTLAVHLSVVSNSGAVQGAAREKVEAIAGIEMDPTGYRRVGGLWPESFRGVEVAHPDREGEKGRDWRDFSLGRATTKKGFREDTPAKWEKVEAKGNSVAIFTDGSRGEKGGVGGGWGWTQEVAGESEGFRWVGTKATVWDGKVAGMRGALEFVDGWAKVLLLADSQAAISAPKRAGKTGKGRTADLV
ncbi:hypothetical protein BDZ91DRAFT_793114 [Kalaharituber pfeilii]|nr:hypothetical protein BDZ91DRAFT_793114 [Kalaharituber pfeilii]